MLPLEYFPLPQQRIEELVMLCESTTILLNHHERRINR